MARILFQNSGTLGYDDLVNPAFNPGYGIEEPEVIVAQDILDKFNIPYEGDLPPRGKVVDFDIYNMDPVTAMRLSLAENFIDSKLYEVHINESGRARWTLVGGSTWTPPDKACLMFSAPSYSPRLQGDLVVVRGFDRPPERHIPANRTIDLLNHDGPSSSSSSIIVQPIDTSEPDNVTSGLGNKTKEFGNSPTSYAGSIVNKHAAIIYYEPVLDQAYKDDILGSYDPRCFESLIGWMYEIKYNLKDALDVDAQIEFSNTTTVGVPLIHSGNSFVDPPERYFVPDISRIRNAIVRKSPYGEPYSTFQEVNSVIIYGYRVSSVNEYLDPLSGNPVKVFVAERSKGDSENAGTRIVQLSQGTDWTWSYSQSSNPNNPGSIGISVIESPETIALVGTQSSRVKVSWGSTGQFSYDSDTLGINWMAVGDGLGYIVGGIFANLVLNVPSVNIYSPAGKAYQIAEALKNGEFAKLTPVVLFDAPAPIYYRFKPGKGTDAGFSSDAGFIDQEEDIVDADPTTIQDLEITDSKKLQNATNGFTVDVSLPFVKGGKITRSNNRSACLSSEVNSTEGEQDIISVRDFIYDLYNDDISVSKQETYSAGVLDDLPQIGQSYEGGIINSISYSYQDSGSFTATINVGAKLLNSGSWGTSIYRKQTEDISREGTIVQTAGNGSVFAVKVWNLGIYSAISSIREELEVGDRVQITIYNHILEA